MEAAYLHSAQKPENLPAEDLAEIAFIGRSNCGKSTLLNSLCARQNLARHSRTPGRTQMVNFFSWGKDRLLVDLPGYGFSRADKKIAQHWDRLIDAYLKRKSIKHFLFLFDCRRDLDEVDFGLLQRISAIAPTYVVLTKADKITRSAGKPLIQKTTRLLQEKGCFYVDVILVSCLAHADKKGVETLRECLSQ